MERLFIDQLDENKQEEVLLRGWIHKIISFGTMSFIHLRDKTGIVQLVVNKEIAKGLRLEMSIEVTGEVVHEEKASGGLEIHVKNIEVLGKAYYEMLPIQINQYKKNTHLEIELDFRSLSLRTPKNRAIFKVQEEIETSFRNFLRENKFSEIHTPKIIASGTEGGSEMFTVNYFDKRAFLAQSPQFYKQMMVGAGFERVYEVDHAYRAELHNTYRHLNEYVSMDFEIAFIKDENDIMDLEEGYIRYMFNHVKNSCQKELKMHSVNIPENVKIPRIPLADAQNILLEKYKKVSPVGNIDAEGEELIAKYVKEKYNSDFVFLTAYPVAKRPMYAMPDGEGNTKSFDLIYKGLEITTGGQRIHDYEMLKANIIKFGLNPEDFSFYLESFRYGMPPHGGLAIGLERITMQLLGLKNIREASLLPRDMGRIEP